MSNKKYLSMCIEQSSFTKLSTDIVNLFDLSFQIG